MKDNGRSSTIDFMRIIFATAVVMFHGKQVFEVPILDGKLFVRGAYGVDFFFIVSGYLLTSSVYELQEEKIKNIDQLCNETIFYVRKRLKKIFPYHLIAFIVAFIVQISIHSYGVNSIGTVIEYFIAALPQLFLVHGGGIYIKNVNSVTWYLSSMFLMIFIIYPCLRKYYDFVSKIIVPIMCTWIWSWLLNENGSLLANWAEWNGFFYFGFIKACVEMLMGVITFNISKYLINTIKKSQKNRLISTGFEIIGYCELLIFMSSSQDSKYAFVLIPMLAFAVAISFSGISYSNELFNKKKIQVFSSITLPLYLNQMWCRYLIENYAPIIKPEISQVEMYICYLILSFAVAIMVEFGVNRSLKNSNRMID